MSCKSLKYHSAPVAQTGKSSGFLNRGPDVQIVSGAPALLSRMRAPGRSGRAALLCLSLFYLLHMPLMLGCPAHHATHHGQVKAGVSTICVCATNTGTALMASVQTRPPAWTGGVALPPLVSQLWGTQFRIYPHLTRAPPA